MLQKAKYHQPDAQLLAREQRRENTITMEITFLLPSKGNIVRNHDNELMSLCHCSRSLAALVFLCMCLLVAVMEQFY